MRVPGRWMSALAVVVAMTVAGCGGSDESMQTSEGTPSPTATPSTPSQSTPSPSTPSESSPSPSSRSESTPADDAVEIEVEVENGQVTPSGQRVDVEVGQPIRFVVDSDAADEIHVHSTPEHTFTFPAGADDRTFEFKLTQPGVVEAELHELGDVVVTIAARP